MFDLRVERIVDPSLALVRSLGQFDTQIERICGLVWSGPTFVLLNCPSLCDCVASNVTVSFLMRSFECQSGALSHDASSVNQLWFMSERTATGAASSVVATRALIRQIKHDV